MVGDRDWHRDSVFDLAHHAYETERGILSRQLYTSYVYYTYVNPIRELRKPEEHDDEQGEPQALESPESITRNRLTKRRRRLLLTIGALGAIAATIIAIAITHPWVRAILLILAIAWLNRD